MPGSVAAGAARNKRRGTRRPAKAASVRVADRGEELNRRRNLKMARSAHAYVRGSTAAFYGWLEGAGRRAVPQGPAVWICGDCHVGNLGPVADVEGELDIEIRDLDQAVIGNPAHDLIRLGLSLATAARGSDLPGVTTARMLEQIILGYSHILRQGEEAVISGRKPEALDTVMQLALRRRWKHLARERIEDTTPTIPMGKRFWPLSRQERRALEEVFADEQIRQLLTSVEKRDADAPVRIVDAAYWMKGCSSLGKLRYAVLAAIGTGKDQKFCLVDLKEAVQAVAPRYPRIRMPRDNAVRIVTAARAISPALGDRMRATRLLGKAVVVRELFPQDLKLEIERLGRGEAMSVAHSLAQVVARAHSRQMDAQSRRRWLAELNRSGSRNLDAPTWLWKAVVGMMAHHEAGYLEHCRVHVEQL
jgi:uncharacterized protein (DUF2252 family)